MATAKSVGKSGFLKEFFLDHPDAGKASVDAAWREAGNDGTISDSLISKIRKDLGLTAKDRTKAKANGRHVTERPERPAEPPAAGDDRTRVLIRSEGQIDDMIHEVKLVGGLPEFEETLRKARRILVRSHEE